jgi:putative ABC transport system substrate-binding protein
MLGAVVRRREFIKIVAGSAAAWPLAARAQPTGPVRLIGVLMDYAESDPVSEALIAVFRDELAKLGWKEGGNLRIEVRWSAGSADRVRTFAKELVNLRPDAILGRGTPETIALARETRTIPIVFAAASDPIGNGFVASLTHPGGNISGFTNVESTVGGKWVGLLKEIAPRTTHVAVLFNPATGAAGPVLHAVHSSGSSILCDPGEYRSGSHHGWDRGRYHYTGPRSGRRSHHDAGHIQRDKS